MAGNTAGYHIVNAGFEDGVVIRAKVQFQLLINKPEFELVLMSDGGGDFYAVSYGANARVSQRRPEDRYRRQPDQDVPQEPQGLGPEA